MKYQIGQEVFVLYKVKNNKGVYKWRFTNGKRKIVDVGKEYIFDDPPYKVYDKNVVLSRSGAERICEVRNNWRKYRNTKGQYRN